MSTLQQLSAFGLKIISDWSLPGSQPVPDTVAGAATRVRGGDRDEFERAWAQPGRRVLEGFSSRGGAEYTVDLADAACRFWLAGHGRYLVTRDGTTIACEAGPQTPDDRLRFLVAQALPVASLMQGYEVLHAGAVHRSGGVAAFTGPSGAGKSTLTAALVTDGAGFFCDDVLAIEARSGVVMAHRGIPAIALHPVDPGTDAGFGETVPATQKVSVPMTATCPSAPLRALYHLQRGPELRIWPPPHTEGARALEIFFAAHIMTPERMLRHLSMAHLLTLSVSQFNLQLPPSGVTPEVAGAVSAHLEDQLA